MKLIFYVIIVIIVKWLQDKTTVDYEPEGKKNNKSYGKNSESIPVLLDRIEWANHYTGRIDIFSRFLRDSIILSFMLCIIIQNGIPSPLLYIQCVLITYILLRSFYFYSRHHCDKFHSYSIDRNINILRKKLKLKKRRIPDITKYKFSGQSKCWNFIYRTED
jgi:hypothetical protein